MHYVEAGFIQVMLLGRMRMAIYVIERKKELIKPGSFQI